MSYRKLSDLATSKGKTLDALSILLGLDSRLLRNVDAGLQALPSSLMPAIANVLGVDVSEVAYAASSTYAVTPPTGLNPFVSPTIIGDLRPAPSVVTPVGFSAPFTISKAFSARDIPNCILWLRGDLGVTTSTGTPTGTVTTWADQSGFGNDFTQGTDANRPVWAANGYPYPYLYSPQGGGPTTAQFLQRANPLGPFGDEFTYVAVFAAGQSTSGGYVTAYYPLNGVSLLDSYAAPGNIAFYNTDGVHTDNQNFTSSATLGNIQVCVVAQNKTSTQMYLNGAQVASYTPTCNQQRLGQFGINRILGWGTGYTMQGGLYEVIAFNRKLSSTEIASLNSYLTARYLNRAFAPGQLATMEYWFRADRGITLSGSRVTQWADPMKGHIYIQGGASCPTWTPSLVNGQPALTFDGTAQYLSPNEGPSVQATTETLIMVVRNRNVTLQDAFWSSRGVGLIPTNGSDMFWGVTGGFPTAFIYMDQVLPSPALTGSNVSFANNQTIITQVDLQYGAGNTGSRTLYTNGILDHSDPTSSNAQVFLVGAYLGYDPSNASHWPGDVMELMAWPRMLSANERASVTAYLKSRYAIP